VPAREATHSGTRNLAVHLHVSHVMVARVWRRYLPKPHRIERVIWVRSAAIIGLYLNPPAPCHRVLLDERTAIQALERQDPVLPLSSGRAERHGLLVLCSWHIVAVCPFNTKTSEVLDKTPARRPSAAFVLFLADIVIKQPRGKEIPVIADSLWAHRCRPVTTSWRHIPSFTCTSHPADSWRLNRVDLWFGKIGRDVVARGVFTSVADLKRKLMRYIQQYIDRSAHRG